MSNRARKLLIDATDYLWIALAFAASADAAIEGSHQAALIGAVATIGLMVLALYERARENSKVYQWSRAWALVRAVGLLSLGAAAMFYWRDDQYLATLAIALGALHLPLVWAPKSMPFWRPIRL